jgi:hypothetical protein
VTAGSDMARARAAAAKILASIAWDVQHIPYSHPLRAENEVMNLQISDLVEVVTTHLKGASFSSPCFQDAWLTLSVDGTAAPADWQAFWGEVYMLFHGLGSSMMKLRENGPSQS